MPLCTVCSFDYVCIVHDSNLSQVERMEDLDILRFIIGIGNVDPNQVCMV